MESAEVGSYPKIKYLHKKGSECLKNTDCPTQRDTFAKCSCSYDSKGTKYCDLEGGDDQWVTARSKVKFMNSLTNISKALGTATLRKDGGNVGNTCCIYSGDAKN